MTRQSTFAAQVERACRTIDLSRFPSPITVRCADYSGNGVEAEVVLSMSVRSVEGRVPLTVSQSTVLTLETVEHRMRVAPISFDRAVVISVWDMAKRMVLHELQECLFVGGRQFEDPHADVRRVAAGGNA